MGTPSSLPSFQTDDQALSFLQSRWASILNPLLRSPLSSNLLLKEVVLVAGDNVINHKLGRTPQGWIISDVNSAISIYRNAPFNELTLTLNSSGNGTINLIIF